jgi:hypothetical protein
MSPALRALLSGIIDYAGLFPPASLSMEQAIRNYAGYRTEPEAWMLGRFVCPAARLGELSPFVDQLFASGPPLAIAALEGKFRTYAEYLEAHRVDETAIITFLKQHRERVAVGVREQRYAGPFDDREIRSCVPKSGAAPTSSEVRNLSRIYYEIEVTPNWRKMVAEFLAPFAEILRQSRDAAAGDRATSSMATAAVPIGFKLRCGGLSAADFPSPENVAFALVACRNAGLPFKATAGLHHPIRGYRDEVKTKMHGFLNVFGAGILAHCCKLTEPQVLEILLDENPRDFLFSDADFRWKDFRAAVDQIMAARESVTAFGSCSFDEPRNDLRSLGLLP